MSNITYFYMRGCPYCRNANKAIEELTQANPLYAVNCADVSKIVGINRIDENDPPADLTGYYDYYYVPTMFIGDEKIYEAHPGQTYEEIREAVKNVFDKALE